MKPVFLTLTLAGVAFAAPTELEKRQATQNGLDGPCKPVTMVFARGSTETGNMVKLTTFGNDVF